MKKVGIDRTMFYGADSETFEKASQLRKNMTIAELVLWKKLRDRELFMTRFRRQHPIGIYIVDFYNHEFKIVIEIDGEIHQSTEVNDYDSKRTYELEKHGLKVLRFTNHQVIYECDSVINHILKTINELDPL
jgi:very-short-patch-repair endonuclease